jgi:hypothetical protein
MDKEPTICQQCNASLLDTRYVFLYSGDKCIGAYCADCDDKNELEKYIKTKRLRTRLIERITLDLFDVGRPWDVWKKEDRKYRNKQFRQIIDSDSVEEIEILQVKLDIWKSNIKLFHKIKEFEREVWFNGLQETIQASKISGVSAEIMSVKCLTFCSAARTMITIEDKESSVTLLCEEDSKENTMHFRGIDATESEAIHLIDLIIETYKDGSLKFKEDKEAYYL